jgi:PKD domain
MNSRNRRVGDIRKNRSHALIARRVRPSQPHGWTLVISLAVLMAIPAVGGFTGAHAAPSIGPALSLPRALPCGGSGAGHCPLQRVSLPPVSGHDLYVTATNLTVQFGDPVTFGGYFPNGTLGSTYAWSFGDGTYANGSLPIVSHVYASPGIYPVFCQANSSAGTPDDNAPALLTITVRDSYRHDTNLSHARVSGAVLVHGVPVDDVTPLFQANTHVLVEGTILNPPSDPYYQTGIPSFQVLPTANPYVSFTSQGVGDHWIANVTFSVGGLGLIHVRFSVPSTPVPGHLGPTLYGNFTFSFLGRAGSATLPSRLPTSPHRGVLKVAESAGGGSTLDPAIAYDTIDAETFANVYEQLITYNGSTVGGTSGDYVPALATCVPGSAACTSLYGSTLVNGWNYTFVLDPSARFYDPSTGANWSVYPSDVVFSVARTLAFSTLPCAGCNNGWILAQTLLPGRASSQDRANGSWDNGIHGVYNNTPQPIFASMSVNDSACPTISGRFDGHGCVTFHAHGNDRVWPFFLSVLADPLGASIVPAAWFSAAPQGAGLPYWTEGNVSGNGDFPLPMINATALGMIGATYWDNFETMGSGPPFWGNVQFVAAGSGPYFVSSYVPAANYTLQANPAYVANSNCAGAGCPPAVGSYLRTIDITFQKGGGATAVAGIANGSYDVATVDPANVTSQLALFERGGAQLLQQLSSLIAFAPFQLLFNVSAAHTVVGVANPVTIPPTWFTYLGMRHLFTAAFPYGTSQATNRTADGFGFASNYGGAIPPALPDYPVNVSWPSGDPGQSATTIGSAAWWWAQITNVSSPYFDPQTTACSALTPCQFPMFPTQLFDWIEMERWAHEVNVTTGGAIQPYVFNTSFINVVISGLFSPPGSGYTPIYGLGWAEDYPDPSDYVTPLYLADSTYTTSSAVYEQLSTYTGSYCSASLAVYAANPTPVNNSCQGSAYAALTAGALQAANLPLGPNRTLLYNQVEQVANQLALYTYTRALGAIDLAAPWIDPSRVVRQPSVAGSGIQIWSEYGYLNNSSTANPLTAYGPILQPNPSNVTSGTPISLAAAAGGGHGGYSYSWNGVPPECAGYPYANFSCVPRTGGLYTVTVTVTDASGANVTSDRVQLFVYAVPQPLVGTDHASVSSGVPPLTVQFTSTVTGGQLPYVLNWSFGDGAFASVPDPSHVYTIAGTFTVQLNITDGHGRKVSASPPLSVRVRVPLAGAAVSASPGAIDLGQSVNLSVSFTGNSGPVTVTWSSLPPGCTPLNLTTLPCTPIAAGVYVIGANLSDSAGSFATATPIVLSVESPLVVSLPHASLGGSEINQTVAFSVGASGGSAPFGAYSWSGFPAGACTGTTTSTATCAFTTAGTLTITAKVTDAIGHTSGPSPALSFTVHPGLQVGAIAISNGTVSGGTTSVPALSFVTFSTSITGGLAPFTYQWKGLPNECPASVSVTLNCVVTTIGTYTVQVVVHDGAGVVVTRSSTLVVTSASTSPPPSPSANLGNPLLLPLLLIAIVIAAVAVVAVLLLRRRRGGAGPDAPDAEGTTTSSTWSTDPASEEGGAAPAESEPPPLSETP